MEAFHTGGLVTRKQIFSFTFFCILLLLIWQLGVILSPFFYPIMWAAHSRHNVLSALPKTSHSGSIVGRSSRQRS